MKATAKTEAAVKQVMGKFMDTYQKRDLQGLMSVFPKDEDLLMYGTGGDEKRIGRDQVKFQAERDWEQTDELAFNITWIQVSEAGPVAWVAADAIGKGKAGEQEIAFPLRMTAVLEQRGSDWFVLQSHVSLPAMGQEDGDSVPV